jgi:hypothetical protein
VITLAALVLWIESKMKRVRIITIKPRQIKISIIPPLLVVLNWHGREQLRKTYRYATRMSNSPLEGTAWTVGYQKHESLVIRG